MAKNRNDRTRKEVRQKEALVRNEKWASIPPEQQLNELNKLNLTATKQRSKISKKIKN